MDPLVRRPSATAPSIGLALCLTAACALYLWRAFDPQLIEFAEGPILAVAERMQQQPLSAHWTDEAPYTLSAYGPAYFVGLVLASKLGPGSVSLVAGRLVALLAMLATAAIIGVGVRRRTNSTERGFLGALAYLVSPAVIYWCPALRVDTLAALFSCAAYLIVGAGRTTLFLSALLVAIGSLVKPTVALSAVPIFGYLLFNRRYRDACWYALAVSLLGALMWWFAVRYSDGYFWIVAVRNNLSRMLFSNGLRSLGTLLLIPFTWLCLFIVARKVKEQGPQATLRSLFCLSFVVSLLISTVLACRAGSHINYFLEACALGSVLIGLCALPPDSTATSGERRFVLALFAVAIVAPGLIALMAWPGAFTRQDAADQRMVKQSLAQVSRDCQVLADGEWVPSVLESGRLPMVNDPFMLRLIADRKLLSMEPIIRALNSGQVCLLILDRPIDEHRLPEPGRWPVVLLDAMAKDFEPVVQRPGLWIYRHRNQH